MNLDDAKKLKEACSIALITSNWVKMTDRHLPPNGEGTQFMSNNANAVVLLIAKAMKLGGDGGTNPGNAACFNIQVVLGKGADGKLIFYSAYPVVAPPPAAGLLGAL